MSKFEQMQKVEEEKKEEKKSLEGTIPVGIMGLCQGYLWRGQDS